MGEFKGVWVSEELMNLGFNPSKTMVLSMIKELQPFHASNKYIGQLLNIAVRSVTGIIADLEDKKFISISGKTSARIITIEKTAIDNYSKICHSTIAKSADTSANIASTIAKSATNRKDNKYKKDNRKVTLPEKDEYIKLAKLIVELHKVSDPVFTKSGAHINNWAKDIRKLVEIDNRSLEDIERIIRWAKTPECFWFPNIISGKKLREKFPTLYAQARTTGEKQETPEDIERQKAYHKLVWGGK